MKFILIQLIGFVAIGVDFVIYQQTKREKILICKGIADVLWSAHHALLGGISGAAVSMIGILREVIFYFRPKARWARSSAWLGVFIAIYLASAIITWKNIYSIFPTIAAVCASIGFWSKKPEITKRMALPVSVCMFIYATSTHSIATMVNETLVCVSLAVSWFRVRRAANQTQKDESGDASIPR